MSSLTATLFVFITGSLTLSLYSTLKVLVQMVVFILLSMCSSVRKCFCGSCQPIKALCRNELFLPHKKRLSLCVSSPPLLCFLEQHEMKFICVHSGNITIQMLQNIKHSIPFLVCKLIFSPTKCMNQHIAQGFKSFFKFNLLIINFKMRLM